MLGSQRQALCSAQGAENLKREWMLGSSVDSASLSEVERLHRQGQVVGSFPWRGSQGRDSGLQRPLSLLVQHVGVRVSLPACCATRL